MSDDFDDPVRPGIAASILNALEDRRALRPRRPGVGIAMVVAVVGIFLGVIWYSYPREAAQQEADIPLVKAEAGPYKAAPDEPGGMDIPNRDSTVFDTLRASNDSGDKVEHLLPPAEQPLPHEQVFAGLKTDVPASVMQPAPNKSDLPATTGALADAPVKDAPVEEAKVDTKPAAALAVKPQETKAAAIAPASGVEVPAAAKGDYFAQLASVRSDAIAQSTWDKLKKTYGNVFGDAAHRVQKADLGAKGTYYRLQAGPVSEARARDICDAVDGKKGGCLVIKR